MSDIKSKIREMSNLYKVLFESGEDVISGKRLIGVGGEGIVDAEEHGLADLLEPLGLPAHPAVPVGVADDGFDVLGPVNDLVDCHVNDVLGVVHVSDEVPDPEPGVRHQDVGVVEYLGRLPDLEDVQHVRGERQRQQDVGKGFVEGHQCVRPVAEHAPDVLPGYDQSYGCERHPHQDIAQTNTPITVSTVVNSRITDAT